MKIDAFVVMKNLLQLLFNEAHFKLRAEVMHLVARSQRQTD